MQENIALRGKTSSRLSNNSLRPGRRGPNAFVLTIALLPLTLLVGGALVATARRTIVTYFDPTPAEYVTRAAAMSQAEYIGSKVLGTPFHAKDALQSWGYSRWRQNAMPVWEVVGTSAAGSYHVRVNGLTGRACSVVRSTLPGLPTDATSAGDLPGLAPVNADPARIQSAQMEALRRLKAFGIDPRRLTPLRRSLTYNFAQEPCDVFLYTRQEPGFGGRTVTITLNQRDGSVEEIWNAAGGL